MVPNALLLSSFFDRALWNGLIRGRGNSIRSTRG
jgi:hypothetical protein